MNDKKIVFSMAIIPLLVGIVARAICLFDFHAGEVWLFSNNIVPAIFEIAAYAYLTVVLFKRKSDKQMLFALFAVTLANFIALFFQPIFSVGILLYVVSMVALVIIAATFCEQDIINVKKEKLISVCKKLYFLPALIILLAIFFPPLNSVFAVIRLNLIPFIDAAASFLIASWIIDPHKNEKKENIKQTVQSSTGDVCDDAYCSLGKHIVLCLFTFGIYSLIWIYKTTRYLNRAKNVECYNPRNKLLLCIFIPFYQIFWLYKHGQRIDILTKEKNLNTSDMATLCLILGIFVPIVAIIIMQDRINAICTAAVGVSCKSDAADELKKYKELLDTGVITQEEFDAKKKQLLGI